MSYMCVMGSEARQSGNRRMTINGKTYEVLAERKVPGFINRFEITLRLPRGKRKYHVVRYEDGSFSGVV